VTAVVPLVVSALALWPPAVGGTSAPPPERPRCAEPIPQELTPPTVKVELQLSTTTVAAGEPLRLKVTARNDGVVPIPYSHSGQTHDFWIRDERGSIWLWSQGKAFTDIFVRAYFMPGETRIARTRWTSLCSQDGKTTHQGLPGPGRYIAQALWVSDVDDDDADGEGAWWSNEVPFRIRPTRSR
jgi:hypothetical protein